MTAEEKVKVTQLFKDGYTIGEISSITAININTVKSFCRRCKASLLITEKDVCKQCGKELHHVPGKRKKVFCDEHCRNAWWNNHSDELAGNMDYDRTCPVCDKKFTSKRKESKYCSRACYYASRRSDGNV